MKRETIVEEIQDGVAVLIMNRPKQKNAFNVRMYDELRGALRDAQEDDSIRAVVITGTEGSFTAGQDLGEMANFPTFDDGEPHGFPPFMDCLCAFDKPLLAAVNGVGVGLGLTMLLHCDIVYMAESARLRAPFVTLGVVPEAASSALLPLLIGWRASYEILYSADWIDAPRALELGLASRVCADDELMPAVRKAAAEIAAQPLGSLRETKRLLLATRDDAVRAARAREDATFARRVGSPENAEAIKAFFEKRKPDFTNVSPASRER